LLGGYAWPTEAATRGSEFEGFVVDFEEARLDCECEWECADRGGGRVEVFVTIADVGLVCTRRVDFDFKCCNEASLIVFEHPF